MIIMRFLFLQNICGLSIIEVFSTFNSITAYKLNYDDVQGLLLRLNLEFWSIEHNSIISLGGTIFYKK